MRVDIIALVVVVGSGILLLNQMIKVEKEEKEIIVKNKTLSFHSKINKKQNRVRSYTFDY